MRPLVVRAPRLALAPPPPAAAAAATSNRHKARQRPATCAAATEEDRDSRTQGRRASSSGRRASKSSDGSSGSGSPGSGTASSSSSQAGPSPRSDSSGPLLLCIRDCSSAAQLHALIVSRAREVHGLEVAAALEVAAQRRLVHPPPPPAVRRQPQLPTTTIAAPGAGLRPPLRNMQRLQAVQPAQPLQGSLTKPSRPASRRAVVVRAEAPKLLPLLASAAALGVTAVTVRHVLIQRQQQGAPAQQQRQRPSSADGPPSGNGSGSSSLPASWAAALASRQVQGLSFGWPLQTKEQKKERQLAGLLQDIEQRQYREEQAAMRHFDARLGLRTKTLAELRALAQQHNIAGRSKMRKRELVAALEASLGIGVQQQLQQQRQLR